MNSTELIREKLTANDIPVSPETAEKLGLYMDLLETWNQKMDLTAVTDPEETADRHFVDSLAILRTPLLKDVSSLIDVGTGAGFPGLVLKIARPDIQLCLLDSLQKRLDFLEEVCDKTQIKDIRFVHSRAEDGARQADLRERFDFAVSRAVASLNVLCEYCLPYVKVGGIFVAMKGKEYEEELSASKNALQILNSTVIRTDTFTLADAGERAIIQIEKTNATPDIYPRTSKKIKSKPL